MVNFVKLDVMNLIGLLINELLKLDVRRKKIGLRKEMSSGYVCERR